MIVDAEMDASSDFCTGSHCSDSDLDSDSEPLCKVKVLVGREKLLSTQASSGRASTVSKYLSSHG